MAVHDRLLVRAVVHFQNPYLIVLTHQRVMLGINLGRVLGRDDRDETKTQHRAIEREWHSHSVLLTIVDCLPKSTQPYSGSGAVSNLARVSQNGRMLSRGLAGQNWGKLFRGKAQ